MCRCAVSIALLSLCAGCKSVPSRPSHEQLQHGYTIVLPGIEGRSFMNANVAKGLRQADPRQAVEVHDWTTGHLGLFLYHLRGEERNQAEASRLARKIVDYQDRYPGRPVYLVGHSGGAGMALRCVRMLPDDRQVDGIVLLAAAVSRDYDLRPALAKTRRGIWNYHSKGDFVLLAAGTSIFGTNDGVHAPSAGAYGFRLPEGALADDYYKLHQIPFRPEMIATGNLSGHAGPTTTAFARKYIARHLR